MGKKKKQPRVITQTEKDIGFRCIRVSRKIADREEIYFDVVELAELLDKYIANHSGTGYGSERRPRQ
jgi:hypothetical protein